MNSYRSHMCGQVMKVWRTTTFKTARWASSSMPSMPWHTGCMTCTLTSALVMWDSVTTWSLLMAATYWTFFSRRPSRVFLERTYGLTRMATHLGGKTHFPSILLEILCSHSLNSLVHQRVTRWIWGPVKGSHVAFCKTLDDFTSLDPKQSLKLNHVRSLDGKCLWWNCQQLMDIWTI